MSVRPLRSSSASAAASGCPASIAHAAPAPSQQPSKIPSARCRSVARDALFDEDLLALKVPGEIRCCEHIAQGVERREMLDRALELHVGEILRVDSRVVNRREAGFTMKPGHEFGQRGAFELEPGRQGADPVETRIIRRDLTARRSGAVAMHYPITGLGQRSIAVGHDLRAALAHRYLETVRGGFNQILRAEVRADAMRSHDAQWRIRAGRRIDVGNAGGEPQLL